MITDRFVEIFGTVVTYLFIVWLLCEVFFERMPRKGELGYVAGMDEQEEDWSWTAIPLAILMLVFLFWPAIRYGKVLMTGDAPLHLFTYLQKNWPGYAYSAWNPQNLGQTTTPFPLIPNGIIYQPVTLVMVLITIGIVIIVRRRRSKC